MELTLTLVVRVVKAACVGVQAEDLAQSESSHVVCFSHCECEPLSLAVPLHMWLLQCVVHAYIRTYVHMNYIAYII